MGTSVCVTGIQKDMLKEFRARSDLFEVFRPELRSAMWRNMEWTKKRTYLPGPLLLPLRHFCAERQIPFAYQGHPASAGWGDASFASQQNDSVRRYLEWASENVTGLVDARDWKTVVTLLAVKAMYYRSNPVVIPMGSRDRAQHLARELEQRVPQPVLHGGALDFARRRRCSVRVCTWQALDALAHAPHVDLDGQNGYADVVLIPDMTDALSHNNADSVAHLWRQRVYGFLGGHCRAFNADEHRRMRFLLGDARFVCYRRARLQVIRHTPPGSGGGKSPRRSTMSALDRKRLLWGDAGRNAHVAGMARRLAEASLDHQRGPDVCPVVILVEGLTHAQAMKESLSDWEIGHQIVTEMQADKALPVAETYIRASGHLALDRHSSLPRQLKKNEASGTQTLVHLTDDAPAWPAKLPEHWELASKELLGKFAQAISSR